MKLRWYVIDAVFRRNLSSYFSGILGYLFIVVFVALGALAAFPATFFANNLATLDQLTRVFPMLLLFIVPAIAMTSWADERRQGTDELLFTLPASDLEILLGKYFAVFGIYITSLLFSISHVLVLTWLGQPDYGVLFATYVGYALAGGALLAAGMVASILTNSVTVAYVLGAVLCAVPVFLDQLGPVVELPLRWLGVSGQPGQLLTQFGIGEQLRDFGIGVIPLSGVLYFISFIVVMLYINLVLISRRHWSSGPQGATMGWHFTARAICLAITLAGLSVLANGLNVRGDLTSEKIYSLTGTTRRLLGEVPSERPVQIRAFVSPDVPRDYVATRQNLVGLLRQFDQVAGAKVEVQIINTEKFSDEAEQAKRFGIEPQEVQSERGGRFVVDDVFLGAVVTAGLDDEVTIPFFDLGTPVEYELIRSVMTVANAKRLKLGVLRTDAKITGGMDMQTFRQSPEWRIVTELKKQYDVREIGPEELADSSLDVLLAVMPSSLTEAEMKPFVEYVSGGHPVLIIDDPLPMFQMSIAPRLPKPRQGGGMFGGGPPPTPKASNGRATALCAALDLEWDVGETVWDVVDPHPQLFEAFRGFDVVYITRSALSPAPFSSTSPITQGLQEVMTFYPGSVRKRPGSALEFSALLRSSKKASLLAWEDVVSENSMMAMFGGGPQLVPFPARNSVTDEEQAIAVRIRSKDGEAAAPTKEGAAPPAKINAVFIADSDLVANEFFLVRDKQWQGLALDNVTFVLNCIDDLAGDSSFMSVRSRRAKQRTLRLVEQATEQFRTELNKQQAEARNSAKQALDAAQKSLDQAVQKIKEDQTLDERTADIRVRIEQERQQKILDDRKLEIESDSARKIRDAKNTAEREIRRTENTVWLLAVVLPPIPAIMIGLLVLARRATEERQSLNPNRMTKRQL